MTLALPRLHWLQELPGRWPGRFFSARNAGGDAEPAGPSSAPQRRPRRENDNSLAAPAGAEPEVCGARVGQGVGGWGGVKKTQALQGLPQPTNRKKAKLRAFPEAHRGDIWGVEGQTPKA